MPKKKMKRKRENQRRRRKLNSKKLNKGFLIEGNIRQINLHNQKYEHNHNQA